MGARRTTGGDCSCCSFTHRAPARAVRCHAGQAAPTTYGGEVGTLTLTKDRANPDNRVLKVALKGLYDDGNTADDYYQVYYGTAYWASALGPQIEDQLISARGTYRGQMSVPMWAFSNTAYSHWFVYAGAASADWKALPTTDLKLVNRCY